MKNKTAILIIYGLLQNPIILNSQEKIQLYFNSNWEVTSKEKAVYLRDAEYDLQTFVLNGKVADRDMKGKPVMEGNYLDGKRNGEFSFYYQGGHVESKGTYLNNKRAGKWLYYYPNGQLKQTVTFLDSPGTGQFKVGEYYERNGKQRILKGTGKWLNDSIKIFGPKGTDFLRIKGRFKNSLRTGVWKLMQVANNKPIQAVRYKKGEFIEFIPVTVSSKTNIKYDYPSRMQQRLSDEFHTGISHNDLFGDTSSWELDDISWRAIGQNYTSSSKTPMPVGTVNQGGKKPPVPNISNSIIYKSYDRELMRIMDNIPDQNIGKLLHTEKIIADTTAFRQLLRDTDIETFFKTISSKENR